MSVTLQNGHSSYTMNPMVVLFLGFAALATASPQWGHGPVADTPEVAAAKAAHLAAVARASGQQQPGAWNGAPAQSWNGAPAQSWNGAPAQSWNGAPAQNWNAQDDDGQWRDDTRLYDQGTPSGQWSGAWNGQQEDDGQWRDDSHLYDNGNSNQAQQWSGPNPSQWAPASQWAGQQPQLHNGETPEVAAARAAHLAAHSAASRRYRRGIHAIAPIATLHSAAIVSPVVHAPVVHAPLVHTSVVSHAPIATVHGIW